MQVHLPIAGLTLNVFHALLLGSGVGLVSGIYGIGGGVISTPIMIFYGLPSAVVVGTSSFQLLGTSIAGTLKNIASGNVDFVAGIIMAVGSFVGSTLGTFILNEATMQGVVDFAVALTFAITMLIVLIPMYVNFIREMLTRMFLRFFGRNEPIVISASRRILNSSNSIFRVYSHIAEVEYNMVVLALLGVVTGMCGGLIGIGGGIIYVPVMTYLFGMPFRVAAATALFQIIPMSANTLFWQVRNGHVDIILGLLLLCSSTITVQLGAALQSKINQKALKISFMILSTVIFVLFVMKLCSQPVNPLLVN